MGHKTTKQRPSTTHLQAIMAKFYENYTQAVEKGGLSRQEGQHIFTTFKKHVEEQMQSPYAFELFHRSVRAPIDYYRLGLDFMRPLVDFKNSKVLGKDNLEKIIQHTQKKDNIILLANHQTETDPQLINLLLEQHYPDFAAEMIFIAGHRVVEDPIAIPISLGCNLLCIYSKRHMNHPPEDKAKKILHNQRTMKKMGELLNEGGHCIYVAPSGGRDRPTPDGQVVPAPLDPDSLEMFWLMAKKAKRPTYFYPLALYTYSILPPPPQVEKELGEQRKVNYAPAYLSFGTAIDMQHFPGSEHENKVQRRLSRAHHINHLIQDNYKKLFEN